GSIRLQNSGFHHDLDVTLVAHARSHHNVSNDSRFHTVVWGDDQILLHGPGFFRIMGSATFDDHSSFQNIEPFEAIFALRPAGADIAAPAGATLVPREQISDTFIIAR